MPLSTLTSSTYRIVSAHRSQGNSTYPLLVFAGIVCLSVVFFFVFSAPGCGRKVPAPSAKGQPLPANNGESTPRSARSATAKSAVKNQPAVSSSAESLILAMTSKLRERNLEGAMQVAGPVGGVGPRADFLRHVLSTAGYRVPAIGAVWQDVGTMSGLSRHQLIIEPDKAELPPPAGKIRADVERDATFRNWHVKEFRFDAALVTQILAVLRTKTIMLEAAPLMPGMPDAMDQSNGFLSHVLTHDFKIARGMTNEKKVTHEKLAGLCIVTEEGEYTPVRSRPLVVTAAGPSNAWAILKLHSAKQNLDSEVGLELGKTPAGQWQIEGLNLDRMLESYAKATGAGSVFYSPIIKSPGGGESIVLYFEFAQSGLHPRALAQLEIVAGILKSDPARKMRITGHSDDVGTDDFNYKLSQARAGNVRKRLGELGVAESQIETIGFGASAPLDPNKQADGTDNPSGRSRNRRTEIYLDF